MDEQVLVATRKSLHGAAELLLAGPQYRAHGTIKLHVTPGGFGAVAAPPRVAGGDLVWPEGRVALAGSCRDLAALIGVDAAPPGNYPDTGGLAPDDPLLVDGSAAELLADWFAQGDAALRDFVPTAVPVLWPEHFDLGITAGEVNYGLSPGDVEHPRPYAYVGPWQPLTGEFWNAPFGALRWAEELPDAASIVAFFTEGRRAASGSAEPHLAAPDRR